MGDKLRRGWADEKAFPPMPGEMIPGPRSKDWAWIEEAIQRDVEREEDRLP